MEPKLEPYKQRMMDEYRELDERKDNLQELLIKWGRGELDFEPACPRELLERQLTVMIEYLSILERRAMIEGVSLFQLFRR